MSKFLNLKKNGLRISNCKIDFFVNIICIYYNKHICD